MTSIELKGLRGLKDLHKLATLPRTVENVAYVLVDQLIAGEYQPRKKNGSGCFNGIS